MQGEAERAALPAAPQIDPHLDADSIELGDPQAL